MTSNGNNSNSPARTLISSAGPIYNALGGSGRFGNPGLPPLEAVTLGGSPHLAKLVYPAVNWEDRFLGCRELGSADPEGARSRAAECAKLPFGGGEPGTREPGDPGSGRPGRGHGGGEAYLAATAGRAQQLDVWPRPERRQERGRRGAGGGGAQKPSGARLHPGAHPARRAQQRQQPGHSSQRGAAARAACQRASEVGGRPAGTRAQSGVGGAGTARPPGSRPPTPPPGPRPRARGAGLEPKPRSEWVGLGRAHSAWLHPPSPPLRSQSRARGGRGRSGNPGRSGRGCRRAPFSVALEFVQPQLI